MQDKTIETLNAILKERPIVMHALNCNAVPIDLDNLGSIDRIICCRRNEYHKAYYIGAIELLNTVLRQNGMTTVSLSMKDNVLSFVPMELIEQEAVDFPGDECPKD